LAFKLAWPSLPFMDRVGLVFLLCLALAVVLSLLQAPRTAALRVELRQVDYTTGAGFNAAAILLLIMLVTLYAVFW
jgi:SSS family solute:Na+ symporter